MLLKTWADTNKYFRRKTNDFWLKIVDRVGYDRKFYCFSLVDSSSLLASGIWQIFSVATGVS